MRQEHRALVFVARSEMDCREMKKEKRHTARRAGGKSYRCLHVGEVQETSGREARELQWQPVLCATRGQLEWQAQ